MVAPAQDTRRDILPEAELPVRVVGTSFEMRTPISPVEVPVTERITQVIVARRDETNREGAAGTQYQRPLPPMEGVDTMAHDDHGKKSDGGSKAHGDSIGNTALKIAGAAAILAFIWAVFLAPSNKNKNSGGQPNVVYMTPAPAVVVAPPMAAYTRPTPSVDFGRHYGGRTRTRTYIVPAPCHDGRPRGRDGLCHKVTVTWHPGNPPR
jgi:hypothetical protein